METNVSLKHEESGLGLLLLDCFQKARAETAGIAEDQYHIPVSHQEAVRTRFITGLVMTREASTHHPAQAGSQCLGLANDQNFDVFGQNQVIVRTTVQDMIDQTVT